MPITNDPNNFGRVVDYTGSINIIPNNWGVVNQIGLFDNIHGTQKSIMIGRTTEDEHIMVDRNWDERNPTIGRGAKDWLTLPIPHYPVDDAILPNDLDGVLDFNSLLQGGLQLESVERVRARKMERLRRAHATLLDLARIQVLKNGTVYAPNGTVNINYYTEYNVSRQTKFLNLASNVVKPQAGIDAAIAHIQDNLKTGDVVNNFVALCSSGFFNALTNNAFVQEQYLYFPRTNLQNQDGVSIGRNAGGVFGLDARYRTFEYGGVLFIEVRGTVGGTPLIEADKAYMFPLGTDHFETHFAPANRLSTVNKAALESYYFEYINEKDDIIELMTETNFLNVLRRPELVVTLDKAES